MKSTKSVLAATWVWLAVPSFCVGADWDQVFKQPEVRPADGERAAQPVAAQPAATQPADRRVTAASARASRTRGAARPATTVTAQSAGTRAATTRAPPAAPTDTASTDVARGVELYRGGRIADAAKVFENRALAAATPAEQSTTMFRVGVQWHNDILEATPDKKAAIRDAAVSAYQKTLQINPKSGPALNNLAQLLKNNPANSAEADALLARAVELNDSRKGVYLMNRAELKRDAGDLKTASALAMQAAADDKANVQAHELVLNVLAKREDAGALIAYVRDLEQRGLVIRALDSAVDGMSRLPGARKQLLLSVASTLGNEAYTTDPSEFEKSPAGTTLSGFSGDAAIGPGVVELFRVLREPMPAQSLTWWREGFNGYVEPMKDKPAAAMQVLTRHCGELYHAARDKRAEGYFEMSVVLSGKDSTDPRALLGLTEILFEQQRLDDLNRVLRENEQGLMQAKRESMAASDDLHTYELRLALGMMYGYTGRWVNPSQRYAASIWMLENAQASAREYNGRANLSGDQAVKLPPNAVKMLSAGYGHDNKPDRAIAVRLEFAELYLKNGQKKLAQLVLDPAWQRSLPASLDPGVRQRLADLTAKAAG